MQQECLRLAKINIVFYILCISQSAQAWITQFYLRICKYTMPAFVDK